MEEEGKKRGGGDVFFASLQSVAPAVRRWASRLISFQLVEYIINGSKQKG